MTPGQRIALFGGPLGPQLISNGDFNNSIVGWTASHFSGASDAVISWSAGQLSVSNNGIATNGSAYQVIPTVIGKSYRISALLTPNNNGYVQLGAGTSPTGLTTFSAAITGTTPTSVSFDYLATSITTYVSPFLQSTTTNVGLIDNISARLIRGK